MRCPIWKAVFPPLIFLLFLPMRAEERPVLPSQDTPLPNLHALAAPSGYIFAGTVKAIERIKPRHHNSVGVIRITFYVSRGYRGVHTGQTFAIREWAGLWQSGDRYRVGERVMLFLYPPSKLGLTSPVPNGRLPVDSSGRVVIPSPHLPSLPSPIRSGLPSGYRISLQDFDTALRRAEQE
jgi:hypothetical protein